MIETLAETWHAADRAPPHDHVIVLSNADWSDYRRMVKVRGERPLPRIAYLDGVMELMTPSINHEQLKSRIGRLIEIFCLHHGIEFSVFGSWRIGRRARGAAVEPDECYVFGARPPGDHPDLAIEVEWTSAGLDKLTAYERLGVPEVWIWRGGQLLIHTLQPNGGYTTSGTSKLLPALDLPVLVEALDRPTTSQSMRDYGAALERPDRR